MLNVLARHDERIRPAREPLVERGDMQMPVRVVYQVGMDFVGEDQYVVFTHSSPMRVSSSR